VKSPERAAAAQGSPFFNVLGWIHALLGVIVPIRLYLAYQVLWQFMSWFELSRSRKVTYVAGLADALFLGALSIVSGAMLLQRRSRAPMFACLAGGAILSDVVYRTYSLHQYTLQIILNSFAESRYWFLGFGPAEDILLDGIRLCAWLATLGGIYRHASRLEFPPARPQVTRANFWIWIAISAGVEGLLKAWMAILLWGSDAP
jgi:hypothetical protein